jgi:protein translocase SecG subunit
MDIRQIASAFKPYLPATQIGVALLLTLLVLLQPRGDALGSAFGQSFFSVGKLRGVSKKIFGFTVFLGFSFILLALLGLVI